ncbi:MAG: LptF/LptG family permease [Phycisphaerae bacterium]
MSIVDRYVARTFLSGYVILMLVGIGLYILTDLLVNIDEFTEDDSLPVLEVLRLMADYYLCNLPLYYSQLGGPLMAIAAGFTLGMMLRNNELTALIVAGMPLQRLAVPVAVCSVLLVAVWMANRELLLPKLAHKIARKHDDVIVQRTTGVHCARDDNNAILHAASFFPRESRLESLFIIEPDAEDRPRHLIQADAATYNVERRIWELARGTRVTLYDPLEDRGLGPPIQPEYVDEYPFTLTPEELVLRRNSQWADLLSLTQLNTLLQSRNLASRPTIDMSRHIRLTQPLLQWVLLLLALPFFLTREPCNVMAAGGRALLLAGAFFLVAFVAHSIVKEEAYAALIAWIPILIFGPLAAVQLANVKT